jgi:hypothetical protein
MARLRFPDLELAPPSESEQLDKRVKMLEKKVKHLYVLSYVSTLIIIAIKFIF